MYHCNYHNVTETFENKDDVILLINITPLTRWKAQSLSMEYLLDISITSKNKLPSSVVYNFEFSYNKFITSEDYNRPLYVELLLNYNHF